MRRSLAKAIVVCQLIVFCSLGSVRAGTVTVNYLNGNQYTTGSILQHTTVSADMAGMEVTVYFSDLTWEKATWQQLSGGGYGATGASGWSLSMSDGLDTFYAPWTFTNPSGSGKTITSAKIDAGKGRAVFDVTSDDNPLTPGASTLYSSQGKTFNLLDEDTPVDITLTYSDYVGVGSNAPVGDIWRQMGLTFTNQGGFAPGITFHFSADTDNVGTDLHVVPTPAEWSMVLMSLSVLSGYGFLKRRS